MDTDLTTATTPTQLMHLFSERMAAGDVDGLLELYERDAVFEPRLGVVLRGSEQIRVALSELAALRPRITYAAEPDVVVVADTALVTNEWTMTAGLPDGTSRCEGGTSADVVRRQPDGTWRVLIDQPRGTTIER